MGDFSLSIDNLLKQVNGNVEKVVKKSVFDLTTAIIKDTPVDSGRLRANWQVSLNFETNKKLNSEDTDGSETIAKAKATIFANKIPLFYWINNNLPYADVVEYGLYPNPVKFGSRTKQAKKGSPVMYQVLSIDGYSAKAPQGMVRINVMRFNKFFKDNTR